MMINQLKQILNEEQLAILEKSNKAKVNKAVIDLNKWAEKQLSKKSGYINDILVAETFIKLILDEKVEEVKIKVPTEKAGEKATLKQKSKKEVKAVPKPPKKKAAKKFKEENQIGFGFDLEVQEVEQKPIWEQ